MHLNFRKRLATTAMLTAVILGIGNKPTFADSVEQHNDDSQMNHEQMMNSDGEQMQMLMQECSDNPNAPMNGEQMSIQQCSDDSKTQMNREQMMNSDGEQMQMPMPSDDASSSEK